MSDCVAVHYWTHPPPPLTLNVRLFPSFLNNICFQFQSMSPVTKRTLTMHWSPKSDKISGLISQHPTESRVKLAVEGLDICAFPQHVCMIWIHVFTLSWHGWWVVICLLLSLDVMKQGIQLFQLKSFHFGECWLACLYRNIWPLVSNLLTQLFFPHYLFTCTGAPEVINTCLESL